MLARASEDPEAATALERIRPLQPDSVPAVAREWKDHIGQTAAFGLGAYALVAAAESSKRDEIQQMVDWALENTHLIGPEAPEGSVLYVYMSRSAISVDFGWKWEQTVQLVVARDGMSIRSARATPWWMYTSTPDAAPPGMVPTYEVHAQAPGDKPQWLLKYYDTALLLRSATYELSDAIRARGPAADGEH